MTQHGISVLRTHTAAVLVLAYCVLVVAGLAAANIMLTCDV